MKLILLYFSLFISASVFSQSERRAVYDLKCNLEVVGTTRLINYVCLLPRHILGAQRVDSLFFSHEPDDIYFKEDNIYARFSFRDPMDDININVKAYLTLTNSDLSSKSVRKDTVDLRPFMQSEKYIESDNPKIISLAKRLKGKSPQVTVLNIYQYISGNIHYSGYNPSDVGALATLKTKSGDCTEFADLFVALCRASGIPARVIEGVLVSFKGEGKHNWAEVYFEGSGWVTIDPTANSFNKLKNEYLQVTWNRTNKELKNSRYWYYSYFGDFVDIKESIKAEFLP